MIFKGVQYQRVHNVVALPIEDEFGCRYPFVKEKNHIYFGRVYALGAAKKGAIKTNFYRVKYNEDGERDLNPNHEYLYAVPIPYSGYSLTNLAYGTDGYSYLMLDGKFYRSKTKVPSALNKEKTKP